MKFKNDNAKMVRNMYEIFFIFYPLTYLLFLLTPFLKVCMLPLAVVFYQWLI